MIIDKCSAIFLLSQRLYKRYYIANNLYWIGRANLATYDFSRLYG
jgi:hypothetical protein